MENTPSFELIIKSQVQVIPARKGNILQRFNLIITMPQNDVHLTPRRLTQFICVDRSLSERIKAYTKHAQLMFDYFIFYYSDN